MIIQGNFPLVWSAAGEIKGRKVSPGESIHFDLLSW
jgi:hypothetical protein